MILYFLHGWGFDAGFWSALAPLLPEWRQGCDDRGYFGTASVPAPAGPCIAVAHSFGAMRALSAPPARCRGLIAINGFDRFTGANDVPGVSPRIVDRMIAKFQDDPAAVLTDFRTRIGEAKRSGPADIETLREDLLSLRDGDCTAASAAWHLPILSLQGARDPLLPAPLRESAFAAAPLLERQTHPDGGHLLPVSDAPYCARAIRAFVERAA